MTDPPINLNKARKVRAKDEAKAVAAANRVRFGLTGAQKAAQALDADRRARELAGKKREP